MPCHSTLSDLVNSESWSRILLMLGNTSHRFSSAARERCEQENQILFVFLFPYSPFRHQRVQSNPPLKLRLKTRQSGKRESQNEIAATWISWGHVQGWQRDTRIRPARLHSSWVRIWQSKNLVQILSTASSYPKGENVLNKDFHSLIFIF